RYLLGLLPADLRASAHCFPLESLSADSTGLYDPHGDPIDVLCRLHPLHLFQGQVFEGSARDDSDASSGRTVLDLVAARRLAVLNPPSAFLLESKAVLALIWGLLEDGLYFEAS